MELFFEKRRTASWKENTKEIFKDAGSDNKTWFIEKKDQGGYSEVGGVRARKV